MEWIRPFSTVVWYACLATVSVSIAFCCVWAVVTRTKPWIVFGVVSGVVGVNINVVINFAINFGNLEPDVADLLKMAIPFIIMVSVTYFVGFVLLLQGSKKLKVARSIVFAVCAAFFVAFAVLTIVFYGTEHRKTVHNFAYLFDLSLVVVLLAVIKLVRPTPQDNWEIKELKFVVTSLFLPIIPFVPCALSGIFIYFPLGYPYTLFAILCSILSVLFIRFFYHWVSFHVNGLSAPVMNRGSSSAQADRFSLTAREREIVELLAIGHSNSQIADRLFISPSTVKNHLYNIYQKTGSKNRIEIVKILHAAFVQTNPPDRS